MNTETKPKAAQLTSVLGFGWYTGNKQILKPHRGITNFNKSHYEINSL